ncbi:MAG: PAS domain S-box protein [Polyangiaceae bacterium]|nr:PAS domain S-box protein [Polyangiaceae bacterium]
MALDGSVLIVLDDAAIRHHLASALSGSGVACVSLPDGQDAIRWLDQSAPSVVLLGVSPDEVEANPVLLHVRTSPGLAEVPVVVLAHIGEEADIQRIFAAGADDYVPEPFRPAELVARVRNHVRLREYVERLNRRERDTRTVLELTQSLALTLDATSILFTVTRRIAEFARVDRCSIVLVPQEDDVGFVIASSDDAEIRRLRIDLEEYPEIREVLTTGRPLGIRDATQHPLLEVVRRHEPPLDYPSLTLVPILHEHRPLGVIFLRSREPTSFVDADVALVQTVANATAIALRNADIMESLRAETEESEVARAEAERRLQLFQRYADLFESAADGMIVIDCDGRVLFGNSRAHEITGHVDRSLPDFPFPSLFAESERPRIGRLLQGFREGVYPRGLDLVARSGSGEEVMLSVSFSSVLHEENAILMSFRDVTQERQTARELAGTKEFLERVIESSVDGIVSADLSGTIRIFNRAACRIFGYSASEVIDRLNVEALYPPGLARDVMRRIRDPRLSGHGKLEDYRVEMVNSVGQRIPVSLSASLIMGHSTPVGSVGIITDMRERLRMEERLQTAQEALREREREAIVAELAGGAAHELNQPLTSVMNYGALLTRSLEEGTPLHRAAAVIITESERMAEIVRKIGKITRYETKSYVGEQRILDLERASGDQEE